MIHRSGGGYTVVINCLENLMKHKKFLLYSELFYTIVIKNCFEVNSEFFIHIIRNENELIY